MGDDKAAQPPATGDLEGGRTVVEATPHLGSGERGHPLSAEPTLRTAPPPAAAASSPPRVAQVLRQLVRDTGELAVSATAVRRSLPAQPMQRMIDLAKQGAAAELNARVPPWARWLLFIAATGGLASWLYALGASYYRLPVAERVGHPDYDRLRASATIGLRYGVIAAGLMGLNLLYLLRRRFPRLSVGALSAWLDLHAVTGAAAFVMALFHASFQARSLLSKGMLWGTAGLLATGLVGRFFRALMPRIAASHLDLRRRALTDQAPALEPGLAAVWEALVGGEREPEGLLQEFRQLAATQRHASAVRIRLRGLQRHPQVQQQPALGRTLRILEKEAIARAYAPLVHAVLRTWRVSHRFLAIFVLLAVLLHVGVAWWFGYLS